jgi:hypothetical protein
MPSGGITWSMREDYREGIRAFKEKRPAAFRGE